MRIGSRLGGIGLAFATATASVFGAPAALTQIGALTPAAADSGVVQSKVYALSPDGLYAVGGSNGQNIAGSSTMSQAIIYSTASGLVQVPNAPPSVSDQATAGHGVAVDSAGNLNVAGFFYDSAAGGYRMASYTTSPANLTGGAWTAHSEHGTLVATYNAARIVTWADNSTNVQIAGQRAARVSAMAAVVGSGPTSYTEWRTGTTNPPGPWNLTAVSSVRSSVGSNTGFGVGWDSSNPGGLHRAIKTATPNGTNAVVLQDSGYQSEPLGISPDSSRTPATGLAVGFDQDTTANHYPHASVWDLSGTSISYLAELPGDNQSAAIDVRRFGGNNSNRIIGGYSSDGTTEHAVLWDTTGTWDATGAPKLLSSLLTGLGVDVSGWSSLSRVTTMSDDGKTVGGWGIWAADGTTRGFVATVPEPASLLMLACGALPLLRRRR